MTLPRFTAGCSFVGGWRQGRGHMAERPAGGIVPQICLCQLEDGQCVHDPFFDDCGPGEEARCVPRFYDNIPEPYDCDCVCR